MSANPTDSNSPEPVMYVRLFGACTVTERNDRVKNLDAPRLQSLLAYLVLHKDTAQMRSRVAFKLWPDNTEEQAFSNLRKYLHHLRTALPTANTYLQADAKSIWWSDQLAVSADVIEYEHALEEAAAAEHRQDLATATEHLRRAVGLYRGELLPACEDEWVGEERTRLHNLQSQALRHLAASLEEQGQDDEAIRRTEQLLHHLPADEGAYRRLMRLYLRREDYSAAIQSYHACVAALRDELDVEPDPLTQELYLRLSSRRAEARTDSLVTAVQSMPALVGRSEEWSQIHRVWNLHANGRPQFIFLIGEAGIGKTKLAEEFGDWVGRAGAFKLIGHCYPGGESLAFAPVIELLRTPALRRCWEHLHDIWLVELARLLPEILELRSDLPLPQPLSDSWQRHHLLEAMMRCLSAAHNPLVIVVDDLQWADADTLEWLHFLSHSDGLGQILVIATVRPEDISESSLLHNLLHQLGRADQLHEIQLGSLSAEESQSLLAQVSAGELSSTALHNIGIEAEGNPLFMVEMVRAELSRPDKLMPVGVLPDARTRALPAKVRAVIRARLSHLSPSARDLALQAAVIGREVPIAVLAQAAQRNDKQLAHDLDELWKRRILNIQGRHAYRFTHDFIRDVAYDEISPMFRIFLHRNAAAALVKVNGSQTGFVAGQIANHYLLAGELAEAAIHYQIAARRELQLFSAQSAIRLYHSALDALSRLPATDELRKVERSIQLELGAAYTAAEGVGNVQAADAYQRALALGSEDNDMTTRASALAGLAVCHHYQGNLTLAIDYARQAHSMAMHLQDAELLMRSCALLTSIHFHRGEFKEALENFAVTETCAGRQDLSVALDYSYALMAYGPAALALYIGGKIDVAEQAADTALSQALVTTPPATYVYLEAMFTVGRCLLHQYEAAERGAQRVLADARRWNMQQWMLHGESILNWLAARRGDVGSVGKLRQSIHEYEAFGSRLGLPFYGLLLADAYATQGENEKSATTLAALLPLMAATEERWLEAEILRRLHGMRALAAGSESQSLAELWRALTLAQAQQARLFAMRCSIDLARFLAAQARSEEARTVLESILADFGEQPSLPEWSAACAMRDALAGKPDLHA